MRNMNKNHLPTISLSASFIMNYYKFKNPLNFDFTNGRNYPPRGG